MIKRIIILYCFSRLLPTICTAESFVINNYMVDMKINDNGSLAISETIDVQFSEAKHGIERILPQRYSYDDTRDEVIDYANISTNVTKSTYSEGPDLVLRLGDADRLVNGSQQYIISYTASPGVKQYSGWQELYWNLVGTQWGVPIRQVTFRITTPDGIDLKQLGSGDIQVVAGSDGYTGGVQTTITANEIKGARSNLGINQGITIGIKFNDKTFSKLLSVRYLSKDISMRCSRFGPLAKICSTMQPLRNEILNEPAGFIMLPFGIIGIFMMFRNIYLYIIRGIKNYNRKRMARQGAMIQYYPPTSFLPHEGALILDDGFEDRHFVATLYDWYFRGVISIDSSNNDDIILNLNNSDSTIGCKFEEGLIKGIFGNEDNCHINKLAIGSFMIDEYYNTKAVNNFYRKGVITDKGIELYSYIIGYKQFIQTVESDQLITYLKKDPEFVNKLMPRAIALGLDNVINKTLTPLIEQGLIPDDLLENNYRLKSNVHTIVLSQATKRNSITRSSSHSRRSSFGSSGGGSRSFSGGGRGGGGGRSW